jgi:hypothetical protein
MLPIFPKLPSLPGSWAFAHKAVKDSMMNMRMLLPMPVDRFRNGIIFLS